MSAGQALPCATGMLQACQLCAAQHSMNCVWHSAAQHSTALHGPSTPEVAHLRYACMTPTLIAVCLSITPHTLIGLAAEMSLGFGTGISKCASYSVPQGFQDQLWLPQVGNTGCAVSMFTLHAAPACMTQQQHCHVPHCIDTSSAFYRMLLFSFMNKHLGLYLCLVDTHVTRLHQQSGLLVKMLCNSCTTYGCEL